MNFSITDVFKYWDTLTQYINPATVIIGAVLGGVLGFIIFLVAEILLRKKILIRRRHWSLKYLSYLYMAFFPLFAGFCFTQWFAMHTCERELVKNIPTYLGDANSLFNVYLKDEVVKILDEKHLQLTGHEAIDKAASLAGNTVSEQLKSNISTTDTTLTAKASSFLLSKVAETEFIKNKAVQYVEEKMGSAVMMDKNMTNEVLNVKIENILDDGVLNTIIEKHIRNLFGGFKMNALLIFLIGMAIPIAEIVLAHYLEKKHLKAEPAATASTVPPAPPAMGNTPPAMAKPERNDNTPPF
ncbi:hypothetical protein [Dysgonomonas sp. 521]|uniref:hypothetical protein n=1 Tax=Dysgonomonas sp. 521 TaxID=2302932 RepID=UPI0013D3C9CF|nr:hypothetical protein [Dysgonomonas sp. 521]